MVPYKYLCLFFFCSCCRNLLFLEIISIWQSGLILFSVFAESPHSCPHSLPKAIFNRQRTSSHCIDTFYRFGKRCNRSSPAQRSTHCLSLFVPSETHLPGMFLFLSHPSSKSDKTRFRKLKENRMTSPKIGFPKFPHPFFLGRLAPIGIGRNQFCCCFCIFVLLVNTLPTIPVGTFETRDRSACLLCIGTLCNRTSRVRIKRVTNSFFVFREPRK